MLFTVFILEIHAKELIFKLQRNVKKVRSFDFHLPLYPMLISWILKNRKHLYPPFIVKSLA